MGADKLHEQTDDEIKRTARQLAVLYALAVGASNKRLRDIEKAYVDILSQDNDAKRGSMASQRLVPELTSFLTGLYTTTQKSAFDITRESLRSIGKLNREGMDKVIEGLVKDKGYVKGLSATHFGGYRRQYTTPHIEAELEQAIREAVKQGKGIVPISYMIKKFFNRERNRAVMTARTESTRIESLSRLDSFDGAKRQGFEIKKEWHATLTDDRTRASHLALHGEVVGIHELFSNGCEYPGDPNGLPEEVINCRCAMVPVME